MKQDKEPKKIEMGGFGEPQHLLLVAIHAALTRASMTPQQSAEFSSLLTLTLRPIDPSTIFFQTPTVLSFSVFVWVIFFSCLVKKC